MIELVVLSINKVPRLARPPIKPPKEDAAAAGFSGRADVIENECFDSILLSEEKDILSKPFLNDVPYSDGCRVGKPSGLTRGAILHRLKKKFALSSLLPWHHANPSTPTSSLHIRLPN
jgi:hypothetical protein